MLLIVDRVLVAEDRDSRRAFGFRKVLIILWLFDKLVASQVGLCLMEIENF